MLFYEKYENGRRYVCAYDEEKHGAPRVISDNLTFIYHNSIIVNCVYNTEAEAVASYGMWSTCNIILPDGSITTPVHYFDMPDIKKMFDPWGNVPCKKIIDIN